MNRLLSEIRRRLFPGSIFLIVIGEGENAYVTTTFYSHSKAHAFVADQRRKAASQSMTGFKIHVDGLNVADGDGAMVP